MACISRSADGTGSQKMTREAEARFKPRAPCVSSISRTRVRWPVSKDETVSGKSVSFALRCLRCGQDTGRTRSLTVVATHDATDKVGRDADEIKRLRH
jgi:hypothetical protein